MLTHYKNNWKHTIGLMITIGAGSFSDTKETHGYTHIAEHMMFSGTKKFSRRELQEKFNRVFGYLDAMTGRDHIRIFCYFDLRDFDEAVDILRDMIFNWQCDKKYFSEAKEDLIWEAEDYFKSKDYFLRKSVIDSLPVPKNQTLGTVTGLKKLQFSDLLKVRSHWERILAEYPRRVCALGGNISKKQLNHLRQTFCHKTISVVGWSPEPPKFVCKKNMAVLWYRSPARHLNEILLDRLFSWRAWGKFRDYRFRQIRVMNINSWTIYSEKRVVSPKKAKSLFFEPITKSEFAFGKDVLLSFWRQVLDSVNGIETLEWFEGFGGNIYAPLHTTDLDLIHEYFKNLRFADFDRWMREMMSEV